MSRRAIRESGVSALALLVMALGTGCGSTDDGSSGDKSGPIGGPPHHKVGAQPCPAFTSGYEGDEYCIAPPPEGKGFQLHYGPTDYTDTAEVAKYMIEPGDEVTDCFFVKTPNETEVFLNQYHGRMRPGSHHMITYTQGTARPDSVKPEGCNQGPDSRFLLGAQEPVTDILANDNAPEELGYAMKLAPRLQAAIQVHYVNTTTKAQLKEAWINIVYADPKQVTTLVEPIFWLGGLSMAVKPKTTDIIRGQCEPPPNPPADLHLLQVTGHYHAHTVRFSAWKVDAAGTKTRIYESYSYTDPGWAKFNSRDTNPAPNQSTGKSGGDHTGRLPMRPGDRVEWECEVVNDGDVTLNFANGVYTAEMCNLFGSYAPSFGSTWNCFNN